MADKVDQDLVDDLMKCAVSISAFNTEDDLNMKLSLLQQINKEYNSLHNKLESEDITPGELDMAAPVAKDGLAKEVQRRSDLQMNDEEVEQLLRSSKSAVGQILDFLKQDRTLEIKIGLNFNMPEHEE